MTKFEELLSLVPNESRNKVHKLLIELLESQRFASTKAIEEAIKKTLVTIVTD